MINLVATEIVDVARIDIELTTEEILADLLYPEPVPQESVAQPGR